MNSAHAAMNDPAPNPAPQPVLFTEPTEGAFTLVVPSDWTVQAGVVRQGADGRPWFRVLSPGGGAELRASDPRLPSAFVEPSFGMMPVPGMPVRPFVPAAAFAEEYARGFARERGAQGFEATGYRDARTIIEAYPKPESRQRAQWLLGQGADVGGVTFHCADAGLAGEVDVTVMRMPGVFGSTWSPFVTAMAGPADAWDHVRATLLQIAHSYTASPQWQQGQQQLQNAQHQMNMDTINTGTRILGMQHQSGMEAIRHAGYRAQISADTNAQVSHMQQQTWNQQQATSDEMQRRRVNGINETADLYDPATGDVYRGAPAGYQTYWTDGLGRVVASEGYDNPDVTRFNQATDLDEMR